MMVGVPHKRSIHVEQRHPAKPALEDLDGLRHTPSVMSDQLVAQDIARTSESRVWQLLWTALPVRGGSGDYRLDNSHYRHTSESSAHWMTASGRKPTSKTTRANGHYQSGGDIHLRARSGYGCPVSAEAAIPRPTHVGPSRPRTPSPLLALPPPSSPLHRKLHRILQPVIPPEELPTHHERRRAEDAALQRARGLCLQRVLVLG